MAKNHKKRFVILWLGFLTLVFVANLTVVVAMGVKNQIGNACLDTIPKMEITLAETTLADMIGGDKNTKYPGNTIQVSMCGETREFRDVEIKGRGNSTWGEPKSPYQIKFSEKNDLFGMGKAKKWVLLANFYDDSNLRTDVAFYFERLLGEKYALSGSSSEAST